MIVHIEYEVPYALLEACRGRVEVRDIHARLLKKGDQVIGEFIENDRLNRVLLTVERPFKAPKGRRIRAWPF